MRARPDKSGSCTAQEFCLSTTASRFCKRAGFPGSCGYKFFAVSAGSCAHQAAKVDAVVMIKVAVFNRDDCILHDGRHVADRHEVAPLFPEFTDQHMVASINTQRNFGTVIGQCIDIRKSGGEEKKNIRGK